MIFLATHRRSHLFMKDPPSLYMKPACTTLVSFSRRLDARVSARLWESWEMMSPSVVEEEDNTDWSA